MIKFIRYYSLEIYSVISILFLLIAAIMVEEGLGYMFSLNNLANTSKDSILCFRPLKTTMEANWCLIWKKYQVFSPAAKMFLEKLQENIK